MTSSTQQQGHLEICPSPQAVAQAMADCVITTALDAFAERGTFSIALAGGSSPRAAYELLAQSPHRDAIDWSKVLVLFGDERCVPPDNDQSNFRMANETLLKHVPVSPQLVLRMEGERTPREAAERYAAALQEKLGADPVIDLVLLGLGPDAHTASWFPGVELQEQLLVDAPFVPKFESNRITLTPRVINTARHILVATTGTEKADALAAVFGSKRDSLNIPSQRLAPRQGELTWLVDNAAASGLRQ